MSVTPEVLKLSGWLNADAFCEESKGGHAVQGEAYQSAGRRRRTTAAHAACRGGLDCRLGAGHGEERTRNIWLMLVTLEVSKLSGWLNTDAPWNMPYILVTLEVSKLSGWLNAYANCRVETRAYDAWRGAGREAGGGGRSRRTQRAEEGAIADWWQGTAWSARKTC